MKIVPEKPATRETKRVDPATAAALSAFAPAPAAAPPPPPAAAGSPAAGAGSGERAGEASTGSLAPDAQPPTPSVAVAETSAPTAAPVPVSMPVAPPAPAIEPTIPRSVAASDGEPPVPGVQPSPSPMVTAPAANIVRVGEKQKTENRTVLYPDSAAKARLRHIRDTYKIAEAFVGEDALAYYLEAFSDEEIVTRLRRANRAGLRRPVSFVEIPP